MVFGCSCRCGGGGGDRGVGGGSGRSSREASSRQSGQRAKRRKRAWLAPAPQHSTAAPLIPRYVPRGLLAQVRGAQTRRVGSDLICFQRINDGQLPPVRTRDRRGSNPTGCFPHRPRRITFPRRGVSRLARSPLPSLPSLPPLPVMPLLVVAGLTSPTALSPVTSPSPTAIRPPPTRLTAPNMHPSTMCAGPRSLCSFCRTLPRSSFKGALASCWPILSPTSPSAVKLMGVWSHLDLSSVAAMFCFPIGSRRP